MFGRAQPVFPPHRMVCTGMGVQACGDRPGTGREREKDLRVWVVGGGQRDQLMIDFLGWTWYTSSVQNKECKKRIEEAIMVTILLSMIGQRGVDALAFLLAFVLTALLTSLFRGRLPQDHGRAYAVDGALSKGKARGAGLIFVLCIVLVSLAFMPFHLETVIYMILLIASMLSGYLDDASDTAWNEYKKGLIDFVIAAVAGITYLNFNGCGVQFLSWYFVLPYPVYLLLIIILIWASINVVNCTDGVDGLSASLAVVSMGTFAALYADHLDSYVTATVVFIGSLLAYLWSNAKPSTVLMGDAGSRAMGFFLALLALKSGHPFAFVLAALVFILDGSLGIIKISLKRFLHISVLKNTLTPLHDHARKRLGWSDEQVVLRWVIAQCVVSAVLVAAASSFA